MKNRVVIIQKYVPRYRVAFFNVLKKELAAQQVDLLIVYGRGDLIDISKQDASQLSWGEYVDVITIHTPFGPFYWQNALSFIQKNDLVIVEQANRMLLNYALLFKKAIKQDIKIAFWGHGINRKLKGSSNLNKFKLWITKRADWWFAYTKGVKEVLIEGGLPSDKITAVQNTIDTDSLLRKVDRVGYPEKLLPAMSEDNKYGIFVGSMYKEKQIPFLIKACRQIKEKIPDFHMIFIGTGVDKKEVEAFAKDNPWVHYLGPLFEDDKLQYLKWANVLLIPGAVGLVVIDSFITQTPIITTNTLGHGPEIEYLQSTYNSVITDYNMDDYVGAVVKLLKDSKQLETLKEGCKVSADTFSLSNMVKNFAQGIFNALSL